MRKSHREAERLLRELGFVIVTTGRSKHHYWILRAPTGKTFKQPIPHATEGPNFWQNWKSQLRRHLHDDDYTVNPRSHKPAGA